MIMPDLPVCAVCPSGHRLVVNADCLNVRADAVAALRDVRQEDAARAREEAQRSEEAVARRGAAGREAQQAAP